MTLKNSYQRIKFECDSYVLTLEDPTKFSQAAPGPFILE
jgi:hypothetical protein